MVRSTGNLTSNINELGYPLRGKSSSNFKHITHTLEYITDYNGYVIIIPKTYFSGHEGINSRCRSFGSICRRYEYDNSCCC